MGWVSSVAIDTDGSATDTLVTAAFATTGSNRHVDVVAGQSQGGAGAFAMTSFSRGSETYGHKRTDDNPSGSVWAHSSFWASTTEPQSASAAMTGVSAASEEQWGFTATAYDDIDQTTRFRDLGSGVEVALNPDGDGTVAGLAITSAVGDTIISTICVSGNTAPTAPVDADVTQTLRASWSTGSGLAVGLVATAPGATTATLDWNNTQFRFVHYVASHPPLVETPPALTLPTGYMATNNLAATTISGISVAEGDDPVTLVTFTCTSGKGVFTATGSGSTTVSGNGTNALSLLNGSETDMNNALATVAFQGTAPTQEKVTLAVLATDGTLNDSGNIVVFNDVRSLSVTADSYADAVACIQTLFARLPAGEITDTITITATDEDTLEDEQVITLFVPSNDGTSGGEFGQQKMFHYLGLGF